MVKSNSKRETTSAFGYFASNEAASRQPKTVSSEVGSGQSLIKPANADKLRERGFSTEEVYKIVAPRRTLARRKERGENLTLAESDRVRRLERISDMADRVFGSHDKAQLWLRSEIIALDGARPIDLLETETGAHLIFEELVRIDYGMLA